MNLGAPTPSWQLQSACRNSGVDPDLFYPPRGDHLGTLLAKRLCLKCPARIDCIKAGFGEAFGIWGGLSERDRRDLKKALRKDHDLALALIPIDRKTTNRIAALSVLLDAALEKRKQRVPA